MFLSWHVVVLTRKKTVGCLTLIPKDGSTSREGKVVVERPQIHQNRSHLEDETLDKDSIVSKDH